MKFTAQLVADLLSSNNLKALLDGGYIYRYSGPIPANAAAAVDGTSAKLVKITNSGVGLTLDASVVATSGWLQNPAAASWQGTVSTGGVATFARWCMGADDGSGVAASGAYRVQWSVGMDGDTPEPEEVMNDSTLVSGNPSTVNILKLDMSGML